MAVFLGPHVHVAVVDFVLLRHVVGLDPSQAAAVLGKRPGAVRIATMRGLARLRTLLPPPAPVEQPAPGCNATDLANG